MGVSMEKVYEELKELRKEVSVIGYALIPEEEVSDGELEENNIHSRGDGKRRELSWLPI